MARKKGGPIAFVPTAAQRKTVETMVAYGIPQDDIRLVVLRADGKPIGKAALVRHFRQEIDSGAVTANARVAESLFRLAVGEAKVVQLQPDGRKKTLVERVAPNSSVAIWWSKARMGWKERQEVTGADGGPILVKVERVIIDPADPDR